MLCRSERVYKPELNGAKGRSKPKRRRNEADEEFVELRSLSFQENAGRAKDRSTQKMIERTGK